MKWIFWVLLSAIDFAIAWQDFANYSSSYHFADLLLGILTTGIALFMPFLAIRSRNANT